MDVHVLRGSSLRFWAKDHGGKGQGKNCCVQLKSSPKRLVTSCELATMRVHPQNPPP